MSAYRDEKTKTWYAKFQYVDWQGKLKQTIKLGLKQKRKPFTTKMTSSQQQKKKSILPSTN